jgi:quaternary ammonium compound-resistance protein SugE
MQRAASFEAFLAQIHVSESNPTRFPFLTIELSPNLVRLQRLASQQTDLSPMAWALLGIAGILEIAFAFCMKWSEGFTRLMPGLFTVATGLSSVFLLSLSLRTLPVGTGYAVWTGIGAAGTAILGIAVLGDSAAPMRLLCIGLILTGVIGLKLVSGN